MERRDRSADFRAPPFPEELGAWVRRMDELADASPDEFAIELCAFEERLEEAAPRPGLTEGGMCTMMRLTLAVLDAEAAGSGGGTA